MYFAERENFMSSMKMLISVLFIIQMFLNIFRSWVINVTYAGVASCHKHVQESKCSLGTVCKISTRQKPPCTG